MRKAIGCLLCTALLCVLINLWLALQEPTSPPFAPQYNYLVVANYYNSESSLAYSLPQLRRLLTFLGSPASLYLSIFENGSTDSTAQILTQFAASIDIPHTVITCNYTGSYITQTATSTQKDDFDLKRIVATKRYSRMAALRNIAMRPLYTGQVQFQNSALPTQIIFLNDIYFTAEQILTLLNTNNGDYDLVCGLDFYELFYDILVTRDIQGEWFSGYFPYAKDPVARKAIQAGRPFQVYSCWNGVAIMTATPFTQHNVRFRGRDFDPESSHCECVQSECLLICADFRSAGYDKIYINPQVRVTYEWKHHLLYNSILTPLYQWMQFFLAAFESSRNTAGQGLGCGMPSYWTGEDALYMPMDGKKCDVVFDPDRPGLNYSSYEHRKELTYARRYEERLVEECVLA